MGWRRMVVGLTAKQRRELERLVTRADESAPVVRRAHVVLWSADGVAGARGRRGLHLSAEAGARSWRRVSHGGGGGLPPRPQGGRKEPPVPPATAARAGRAALS